MKKFFVLLLTLLVLAAGTALAKERVPIARTGAHPRVLVVYFNQAGTTYDKAIDKFMLSNLQKELVYLSTDAVNNEPYMELLRRSGIGDITLAERDDFLRVLKGAPLDYVVCVQVEPFLRKETATVFSKGLKMTGTVPFRILDLKQGHFIVSTRLVRQDGTSKMMGKTGNKSNAIKVLNGINKEINAILEEKLS